MNTVVLGLTVLGSVAQGPHLSQLIARNDDETLLQIAQGDAEFAKRRDDYKCTPLHYVARHGRTKTLTWLIEHGADVNAVAYNDFTPMHLVGDATAARLLIKAGANLNARDAWGKTPLQNAAELELKLVAEAILDSGFPLDLASALWLGKREAAIKLIKEQPAIVRVVENQADLWGNTSPLGIAVSKGDRELVDLLLKAGAPVNATTDRPNAGLVTPLSNAVLKGDYEIAELLCKAGADCNVGAAKGYRNLLDYARKKSDNKMVDLLLKFGAKSSSVER